MSLRSMRSANLGDADDLLAVKNDPDVRFYSIVSKEEIKRDAHIQWLKAKMKDSNTRIFCICDGFEAVIGDMRVDFYNDFTAEISVRLLPAFRRKGTGSWAVQNGIEVARALKGDGVKIVAKIVAGNEPSLRTFKKRGFKIDFTQNGVHYLSLGKGA